MDNKNSNTHQSAGNNSNVAGRDINTSLYKIDTINNTCHAYLSAKYDFVNLGGVCHLYSYLKYWIMVPLIFFSIFLINIIFFKIVTISIISFILFIPSLLLYIIRSNEYDSLRSNGFCCTCSNKLYFLDYDSNYIIRYEVKGICPIQGCNYAMHFTTVVANQEGYKYAVACYNSPPHRFRFNFSGEGELITSLTPIPKNPRS
ncbi:hypothetical protein [Francisella frigiditurris]|uniref:Transmembrane protein n=1 Tax=Francisella frigiditurris TaxID=1542390 RepID=A0A1J0KU40_9GAMM|nr:hypothetical protein [Francisella frigiditurris]APC97285.1 hypothetical protein KX01_1462 [Francisella frigiditurris]